MPSLLALDCSMYVGWSFFRSADDMPKCRTWVATGGLWKSDAYAPYFLEFEKWLTDMLDVLQPDILAFESPLVVPRGGFGEDRGSDQNNIRRLIGVVSIAELITARRKLPCYEVDNMTAKQFMGVSHRRQEGETQAQYKDRMIVAVTKMGYSAADSHQSDAIAVGLVVYDMLAD